MGKHKKKIAQHSRLANICILEKKLQRQLYCSEKTTATFVSSQIGDRWIGKWATKRHQNPLGRPHQCDPGSNPGVDSKRSYSLLLVLSFASRGFSPDTPVFPCPQKPTLPNSNSILNAQTRLNEFIRTPKCFVGKQITIYSLQPAILRKSIYKYRREEGAWIGVWNNRHSWTQVFFWLEFANIFTSGQG